MKSPRAPQWEKNNTGSQLCPCSILCCDCFHLVCFLPRRAINPAEIFMKFNNQSFKSLPLSPMAFCKKVIAASQSSSGCWLLGNNQRNSFHYENLFHTSLILSQGPDTTNTTWSPEGHSSVIVCMTSPGNSAV